MKFLGMVKANAAMAKAKLMTNVIMATGGMQTRDYVVGIITAILTVVAGGGGAWLIVVGVKDVIKSFSGESKDWGGVFKGIGTGIVGGAIFIASAGVLINMFRSFGGDFNMIH